MEETESRRYSFRQIYPAARGRRELTLKEVNLR